VPTVRHGAARPFGFTLVEIMITVVIIGLLAAMAIPTVKRVQRRSRDARFISDIRTFAEAFEVYAMKTGAWPPDANRSVVPNGMSGEFRNADWTGRNSLGGVWDWDYKTNGITAAISTVEVTVDDQEMTQIDAMFDDGNLAKGNFVKSATGRYSYILQK
jgi:prepilin-type N-terminal cleavage/methylation domain-containing protein